MRKSLLCAFVSLGALAAAAQTAAAQPVASGDSATLGEIVVTARRRAESLQEVPQTVNAVTSDTLSKLSITQFTDIQNVVPGISLAQSNSGFTGAASMRGVTYEGVTSTSPTVAQYMNDAPVGAVETFQSMFDVGQIEVLKGPQGTTRGVAAPSGAITLTTRRPDLSRFGGYLDGTFTDLGGRNVNGAVNLPIIEDVLAVRIAGLIDQNNFDGVRSINSRIKPRAVTGAQRLSVSYEPTDSFNANVMWQHLDRDQEGFGQVVGRGHGLLTAPPLTAKQRVSVSDLPTSFKQNSDIVTAQFDSRLFGQHLSYVGSYHMFKIRQDSVSDTGNVLPGIEIFQRTRSQNETTTHELRLASDPAPDRFFDYTVGAFYSFATAPVDVINPGPLQPGAFGTPAAAPNLAAYNPSYQIPINIVGDGLFQEVSVFGNVNLHLGSKTELSAGVRHISYNLKSSLQIQLGDGKLALPAFIFGGNCAATTYAGFCDVSVPGGMVISDFSTRTKNNPTIYNVSLSHHLTRDILLYANTGSSWRPPVTSIGLQGAIVSSPDPVVSSLTQHPAEKSKSYEVGVKSTFLDGRARLNVAAFHQDFKNLTTLVPGVNYFNTATGQVATFDFTASIDAEVDGFDIDGAFQITPEWSVSAQASYAHGKVKGSSTPCNAPGAVLGPTNLVSLCSGGSVSRLPLWSASVQTEYTRPLLDDMDGFVRGLLTYYPENKYVRPNFAADKYSLLNLYAGVRAHDGAWEISLFARNALNTKEQLDEGESELNLNGSLGSSFPQLNVPSGYVDARFTRPREIGIHMRYALGSR